MSDGTRTKTYSLYLRNGISYPAAPWCVFVEVFLMEQLSSEFQALRLRLEGDGWDVQYITPHDPIQIEGYLPSEEPFFFQVEDGRASIMIYLLDGESTWTAEMRGEVAKWSLGREVERYLDTLTDLYYNGVQDKTKIVVTAR